MAYRNGTYVAFDGNGEKILLTVTLNIIAYLKDGKILKILNSLLTILMKKLTV